MNHAITGELEFFMISILCGGILLLVYDVFRIFRRLVRHDSFFIAFEDLIFWVAASLFIFAMMYKENNGIIRGFSIMGMFIGMVLYHYIFSEVLVTYVTKFIRILLKPLELVFRFVKGLVLRIARVGKIVIIYLLNQLKKWNKSVKITLNARRRKKLQDRKLKNEKNRTKKQKSKDREKKSDKRNITENDSREKNIKEKYSKENYSREKNFKEKSKEKISNGKTIKRKI